MDSIGNDSRLAVDPRLNQLKSKRLQKIVQKKEKGIALSRGDMTFLLSEMSQRNEDLLAECRALRNRLAKYENGIIIPAGVKL